MTMTSLHRKEMMATAVKRWTVGLISASCLAWIATACQQQEEAGSATAAYAEDANYQGNIRVSLTHPNTGPDAQQEDYYLVVAAPLTTNAMAYCSIDLPSDCTSSKYGMRKLENPANSTKNFFVSNRSVLLQNNLAMTLVAWDSAGKAIEARHVRFDYLNGGTSTDINATINTNFSTSPLPGGTSVSASDRANADNIVFTNCSNASCHPTYQSVAGLSGTGAASQIRSGAMPRGRTLSAADKELLLRVLSATP